MVSLPLRAQKPVNYLVSFDTSHLMAALSFMRRKSWCCKCLIILVALLYPVECLSGLGFEELRVDVAEFKQMLDLELRCGGLGDLEPLFHQVGGRPPVLLRVYAVLIRVIWEMFRYDWVNRGSEKSAYQRKNSSLAVLCRPPAWLSRTFAGQACRSMAAVHSRRK